MKISDNNMKDNKETVYTPYTYLIGWSKFNKWYYGSRYATKYKCRYESGCHPKDLWDTYHTSSDIVTAFRKEHGEPDVREIRKTFSNADDAVDWETKVLQRMNVVKDDKWLNGTIAFPPPPKYGEDHPRYIDGRTGDPEWKRKLSRKYRENNPEKNRESSRKYRENNPEKVRESDRKRREKNREKNWESQRKYRENNPEKVRESQRKYYENNREKRQEEERERYKKNRERILEQKRKYHAKKKLEKSLQTASNSIV